MKEIACDVTLGVLKGAINKMHHHHHHVLESITFIVFRGLKCTYREKRISAPVGDENEISGQRGKWK